MLCCSWKLLGSCQAVLCGGWKLLGICGADLLWRRVPGSWVLGGGGCIGGLTIDLRMMGRWWAGVALNRCCSAVACWDSRGHCCRRGVRWHVTMAIGHGRGPGVLWGSCVVAWWIRSLVMRYLCLLLRVLSGRWIRRNMCGSTVVLLIVSWMMIAGVLIWLR